MELHNDFWIIANVAADSFDFLSHNGSAGKKLKIKKKSKIAFLYSPQDKEAIALQEELV